MSEYRTTATLTAEGTFVVPAPKDLPEGTRAEVTVRVEEAAPPDRVFREREDARAGTVHLRPCGVPPGDAPGSQDARPLHLATAPRHGCAEFWTSDLELARRSVGLAFRTF